MTLRRSRRDLAKERLWRETVGAQTRSGQSVREFCRERQLAESAFYFWRRELRQRDAKVSLPQSERRLTEASGANGNEIFVPVSLAKADCPGSTPTTGEELAEISVPVIEMTLPSGTVLRWSNTDAATIIESIATLEARLC